MGRNRGKLVALVSGGIDSPVAAYLMMKKGFDVIPLTLDLQPFTTATTLERAIEVCGKVAQCTNREVSMYIVPHGQSLAEVMNKAPRRLTCVLCRRLMYRIGELVAGREGADALVTGESLGQVASQTLVNLAAEDQAVSIPVLRPLLGLDKVEIEKIAREIGTYKISIAPAMCCPVPPRKPATRASVEEVLKAEEVIDIDKLLKRAISKIKEVKL